MNIPELLQVDLSYFSNEKKNDDEGENSVQMKCQTAFTSIDDGNYTLHFK